MRTSNRKNVLLRALRISIISALWIASLILLPQAAETVYAQNPGQSQATEALFGLYSPTAGPFPSDWFTVPDHANKTHRRVSLPLPDCQVNVSDCEDIAVLNELDGFNLQPRLSVPFSGSIDPNTVTSDTVFLMSLGIVGPGEDYMPRGTVIGINQVVWDPSTHTLHVESDELLAQHTRFALIVMRGILDENGAPIEAGNAFRRFRADVQEDYKQDLLDAMQAARNAGLREENIATASVFTTQSATAVLEKIRDQIHEATPDPADFFLGSSGARTLFSLNQVANVTWSKQIQHNPVGFDLPFSIDLSPIQNDAVGSIAFGKYRSPNYEIYPLQYIPSVGTRSGAPPVQEISDIYFNLFLPSGPRPTNGWPVAIYVHGITKSKEDINALYFCSSMAKLGIATIAINNVGHGFGGQSTMTVSRTDGSLITFPAGGRGIDQDGNHIIDNIEGISAARPRAIVFFSDGYRQTAADLMQLVRVIEVGMDVDGDGQHDLDPSRIYLFGSSLGGGIGTVFSSVEPNVRVSALSAPVDPIPIGALSCVYRSAAGALFATRKPSLLNSPGIKVLDGCTVSPPRFNENFPLRDQIPLTVQLTSGDTRVIQSPLINTVPGATSIQQAAENLKWVGQAGSPLAYAPHLQKAPLAGMPAKSVLFMIGKGDQSAPNPSTTAILRAGDLADRTLYYRHDLYRNLHPSLPPNPHAFATNFAVFGEISQGAQDMIGEFFFSDGAQLTVPEPSEYFEFPILLPLPEGLNFIAP